MKFLKFNFLSNNSRTECVGMSGVWGWQACGNSRLLVFQDHGYGRILGVIFFLFQNFCVIGKTLYVCVYTYGKISIHL